MTWTMIVYVMIAQRVSRNSLGQVIYSDRLYVERMVNEICPKG